jgi:hypothetical protein
MRNYLNPQRKLFADNSGWDGTYLNCYDDLNLNGYYWPHSEHNQNGVNYVPITSNGEVRLAQNDANQNAVQWIINGSDYDLIAGSGFFCLANPLLGDNDQNDNFFAARGSNLSLRISPQPCSRSTSNYKADEEQAYLWQLMNRTQNIKLPPMGTNKLKLKAGAHIKMFPNPAENQVQIQWSKSLTLDQVRMVNSKGQTVALFQASDSHSLRLALEAYANGLYAVQFLHQNQVLDTQKLHIQH